jgi:hypothetical protein
MSYTYQVEEYSQDSRHYTIESDIKLTEEQITKAYCEVGFKDGDVNEFTLEDIDDDVFTPENKINIKVTFNYTEYGDDSQVNITGDIEEE